MSILEQPDPSLFYRRNEHGDIRFGEIVHTNPQEISSLIEAGLSQKSNCAVIIGFPYDEGTIRNQGRAGAASGPDFIRKAFYRLTPTRSTGMSSISVNLFDAGNISIGMKLEDALAKLEEIVTYFLHVGFTPIVLGGSNDLSYADFRACNNIFKECGAINVDSHLDLREYPNGITSGSPYRMLIDSYILKGVNLVEYGIQEFVNSMDHLVFAKEKGASVVTLSELRFQRNDAAFKKSYERLCKKANCVYVSFDIDSVRGSDAPGVSASLPTGLSAEEICECAYLAGSEQRTAMMDICEFNPRFDVDGRTAKLSALIIASFLAGISNRDN
ncbi:MAG: formimidoylglutamase [Candidatus Kryptoniota bacterium]